MSEPTSLRFRMDAQLENLGASSSSIEVFVIDRGTTPGTQQAVSLGTLRFSSLESFQAFQGQIEELDDVEMVVS